MKKFFFAVLLSLTCLSSAWAQGMSDSQVMQFIASESKAGTSQSQIVTKLMQRGVKIDQIRRLRNEYDKQISSRGLSADRITQPPVRDSADRGVTGYDRRQKQNNRNPDRQPGWRRQSSGGRKKGRVSGTDL